MRMLSLIISAFLLTAATPPIPEVLKPYIKGDRFDPGDYKWMKGRFPDATPEEKAQSEQVKSWLNACFDSDQVERRAELLALNVADPKLDKMDFRDGLCSQIASAPPADLWPNFAAFQRSVQQGTPLANTYLMAVKVAQQVGAASSPKMADLLKARVIGDQMLRFGVGWGSGGMSMAPAVSNEVKAIIEARLSMALVVEDRSNTQWLKRIVNEQGWPKRSDVGEGAAGQAWLLVQHADADPAFQLKSLRLMEPLILSGEVSKGDYAYLYDRVMLKISGKQRYGTQAMCLDGKRVAQPLEDAKAVDRLRGEAGLQPLANYHKGMDASFGQCPTSSSAQHQN